jgi:winged helix DNA-binding protein
LIAWLNRGTLQLVRSEDYPWLHAVTCPPLLNESARRLGVEGITAEVGERAIATIERALADDGPRTRPQLRALLEGKGLPTADGSLSHLCFRAGVLGILVRGPMVGKQHAYVLARDWLGDPEPVDRERALAELARRYLAGHAPAGDRDLARWAGLPLRDARAGLGAIADELEEREDGLLQLAGQRLERELPPPRLLGAFDPVLLGWTSRLDITGRHTELITVNGLFRPFAMVGGRAVAIWRLAKGRVAIEPLGRIAKKDRAVLDADAADVERFMAGL